MGPISGKMHSMYTIKCEYPHFCGSGIVFIDTGLLPLWYLLSPNGFIVRVSL